MHQEAEKVISRQGNEVAEVRKLADELIKQNLSSKQETIDVEKYLHANDVTIRVRKAKDWLESVKESYLSTTVEAKVVMPWTKTHDSFAYREGEVTVYAGSNGGGKSLITGQIALHLVKQNQSVCIASFEMKPVCEGGS